MDEQRTRVRDGVGFVAALDQSGGSTPGALRRYGVADTEYDDDAQMFDLVHAMRSRIMTSRVFDGDRIVAVILFEDTMGREVGGLPTPDYLWRTKRIVPFLKVDRGLAPEAAGAQLMKPVAGLDETLRRARDHGIFGTKMRSVVRGDGDGLDAVVEHQLATARRILEHGLVPIVEPEIDIHAPDKRRLDERLERALHAQLDRLPDGQQVMLKLTLPETDDLYRGLVEHPAVLRVLFLSGGWTREEAVARLARNHGVIASFSRALTEGLDVHQTPEEFDAALDASVAAIAAASRT